MRILIIEDEVTLNKTLAEGLKEFGYQSDVVETLKDGEYYLDIRNYDLVLMDWMLPDGDSVDIIPDIKTNTPKTKVVVLSARDDNESEVTALKAGADDYIRKPFDFDVLEVDRALGIVSLQREGALVQRSREVFARLPF